MNRTDLVEVVAERAGVTRAVVDSVLTSLDEVLVSSVRSGTEVKWPGLLTLDVVTRAARSGRNPQTGEAFNIPARPQTRLRPGARLKAAAHPDSSS